MLNFRMLSILDQRALAAAVKFGEAWSFEHLARFSEAQQEVANIVLTKWFNTTWSQLVEQGAGG